MTLHSQAARVLELARQAGHPEYWELGAAEARALYEQTAPILDARPVPVERVDEAVAPGPAGPVAVRVYHPRPGPGPHPALLWLHGGGHVVGSIDSYDALCRHLALLSGCVVASVGYRLAPEHRFPAAVDDAWAALEWLVAESAELGVDPDRIALGGDSAGGNLAAVVALLARNAGAPAPAFQLLIYPATAPWPDSDSHREFAEGHLLTRRHVDWFQNQYLRGPEDREDPRFAPLLAPSHAGLPDALVIVAGCDPLRDEGIAYAERLREGGAEVELACYEGMIHAFVSLSGIIDAGREAIEHSARALARALRA